MNLRHVQDECGLVPAGKGKAASSSNARNVQPSVSVSDAGVRRSARLSGPNVRDKCARVKKVKKGDRQSVDNTSHVLSKQLAASATGHNSNNIRMCPPGPFPMIDASAHNSVNIEHMQRPSEHNTENEQAPAIQTSVIALPESISVLKPVIQLDDFRHGFYSEPMYSYNDEHEYDDSDMPASPGRLIVVEHNMPQDPSLISTIYLEWCDIRPRRYQVRLNCWDLYPEFIESTLDQSHHISQTELRLSLLSYSPLTQPTSHLHLHSAQMAIYDSNDIESIPQFTKENDNKICTIIGMYFTNIIYDIYYILLYIIYDILLKFYYILFNF